MNIIEIKLNTGLQIETDKNKQYILINKPLVVYFFSVAFFSMKMMTDFFLSLQEMKNDSVCIDNLNFE